MNLFVFLFIIIVAAVFGIATHEAVHLFQFGNYSEVCFLGYNPGLGIAGWVIGKSRAAYSSDIELPAIAAQLLVSVIVSMGLIRYEAMRELRP